MRWGSSIYQLRASGHRISDSDSTGWPSPMAGTPANDRYNEAGNTDFSRKVVELMTGWATPTGRDYKDSSSDGTVPENGLLGRQVWGWNSPRATDGSNGGPNQSGGALSNDAAGWPTPQNSDWKGEGPNPNSQSGHGLSTQAAGWATPQAIDAGKAREPRYKGDAPSEAGNTRDPNKAGSYRADLKDQVGQTQSGSPSETGNKGVLNAALPLWLQGFPSDWLMVAPVKMSRASR